METVSAVVSWANDILWSYLLIFLLCGTGIFFTIKLRFIQLRLFKRSCKYALFGINKGAKADHKGMSSFQSLATAIAAQVGTGNLAGAATAIAAGGPGAVFWMWITAFFGMSTIFAEATLAQVYKEDVNGQVRGGPAYYLSKGVGSKGLAVFFAISIIIALGFIGNMVQANSIGVAFNNSFGVPSLAVGVILAIVAGAIFMGGVKTIASFTSKCVPIMALIYILGCLYVVLNNLDAAANCFALIFEGAFSPEAATGGLLGAGVKEAIRFGVARGLFSNEAGMGSTPHAHAIAKVDHCAQQGVVAMFGVFFDTFIILTLTAVVILMQPLTQTFGGATGIELTQAAFQYSMGSVAGVFIAIALLFFAFSTIVGWYFFGEANIRYLFRELNTDKAVKVYSVLVMAFIVLGCTLKVELVWALADLFNGIMVLPNLVGVLLLSKVVMSRLKDFEDNFIPKEDQKGAGQIPTAQN